MYLLNNKIYVSASRTPSTVRTTKRQEAGTHVLLATTTRKRHFDCDTSRNDGLRNCAFFEQEATSSKWEIMMTWI